MNYREHVPAGRNNRERVRSNPERTPQEYTGLILNASSWRQLRPIIDFHERGNAFETFAAASTFLDIVFDVTAPDRERRKALDRACGRWQRITQNHASKNLWLDSFSARSRVHLAHHATYRAIALERRLPTRAIEEQTYSETLEAAQQQVDSIHDIRDLDSEFREQNTKRLLGVISETAVLLLLKRFSLQHLEEGSWASIPTTFLQESGIARPGAPRGEPWDISVYTARSFGEVPHLTYPIQVKTTRDPDAVCRIPMVCLYPDLTNEGDVGISGRLIIEECTREMNGEATAQNLHNLDMRTEKLLDILDSAQD